MTIFGKRISVAVLLSFVTSVGLTGVGLAQNIIDHWSGNTLSGYALLITGAAGTLASAVAHTWDTMPGNVAPPANPTRWTSP